MINPMVLAKVRQQQMETLKNNIGIHVPLVTNTNYLDPQSGTQTLNYSTPFAEVANKLQLFNSIILANYIKAPLETKLKSPNLPQIPGLQTASAFNNVIPSAGIPQALPPYPQVTIGKFLLMPLINKMQI